MCAGFLPPPPPPPPPIAQGPVPTLALSPISSSSSSFSSSSSSSSSFESSSDSSNPGEAKHETHTHISSESSGKDNQSGTLNLSKGEAHTEELHGPGRYLVTYTLKKGSLQVTGAGDPITITVETVKPIPVVVESGSKTVTATSPEGAEGVYKVTTEPGSCHVHADGDKWTEGKSACKCSHGKEQCSFEESSTAPPDPSSTA
uniref:Uncharacterized protein n=1 Tax=Eutreptiella gymnastica TaxID=73025 RepID=A0A7S1I9I4_9EUGL|mmetsp:Transcript_140728/g.245122  ORF Transcript_140728/g.245122 Transcript_140728/m.245122 type:complete len:202 (+) Transcript_140728:2-607(+)